MFHKNAISWFEIPATDLTRAQTFYETILDITFKHLDLADIKMRIFPSENMMGEEVGGAICMSENFYKPSPTEGPLIYLNANPDVQVVLDKVERAGGKILIPKTQISQEYGYMAVVLDSEGNRIAFHSNPSA